MKSLTFFCVVLAVLCSTLAAPDVDNRAVLVRTPRNFDLMGNTRRLIEQLVENLRNAAQEAFDAVGNFTTAIRNDVINIRERVLDNIEQFRTRVTDSINGVMQKFTDTNLAVSECLDTHRRQAASVFNNTSTATISCVDKQVTDIGAQIENLKTYAKDALDGGSRAISDMKKCTEESPNILAAGSCLGVLAVQTEMKSVSFVAQSVVMIGRINLSLAALPTSFEVCAGTNLVQASMATGSIILDIGSCSANAVFNAIVGDYQPEQ